MGKYSEAFVAFDVAKKKHAVAIAEGGRAGEVRFLGDVENSWLPIERTIKRLADRYDRLHVCFEAGPTGYGLYRQISGSRPRLHGGRSSADPETSGRADQDEPARRGHAGAAAPGRRADRSSAPDADHEAVRDLVRAREAAADDLRRKRQQLLSFLLRHSRIYSGGGHWTLAHRRWLAGQKFEHPAQQIVFQEAIDAIEDAVQRLRRLEKQLALIVPAWSMAPVVEAYQAMRGASFLVAVTSPPRSATCGGSIRRGSSCPSSALYRRKARPATRRDEKASPWPAIAARGGRSSKRPGHTAIRHA